ncbi:MAG TPA: hypothetical protein VF651_07515 [Gammaproteobacteria bacterium]
MTENTDTNILVEKLFGDATEYWKYLGRFIEIFATTELWIFYLLQDQAGLTLPLAKALTSFDRTDAIVETIRKVWAVRPPAEHVFKEFDSVLAQMKHINDARNIVIHYASRRTEDGDRMSTTQARAATPQQIRELRVSPEMLSKMTSDLLKIASHCSSFLLEPEKTLEERTKEDPYLGHAFLYKHEPIQPHLVKRPKNEDRRKD